MTGAAFHQRTITVEKCEIHYFVSPAPGRPTFLLLHCGGGNARWLLPLAKALTGDFAVVVPDLSGHGDSGWRPRYEPHIWAAEAAALIASNAPEGAWLVGHSMGSLVAITAAAATPQAASGLILIDPPLEYVSRHDYPSLGCVYPSEAEAVSAFRLRPPETIARPELLRAIARASVRPVDDGWSWKADGRARQRFDVESVNGALSDVQASVACIYGAMSPYAGARTVEHLAASTGRPVPSYALEGAYHHAPLDDPAGCAAAVRSMYAALA
jgi:pimeloyl-ACP methyl ester carboxylesterase